jgi:SAM-dependent methyltransferase
VGIDVHQCAGCLLVQIPNLLQGDYYDDYIMTVSHSATMRSYQQAQARDFVDRFKLRGKRVLEVGCGDGNYMACLRDAGVEARGNEPSDRFRAMALANGFRVTGGYVRAGASIDGAPYDAVVARQVLEHVPDPTDFLLGIREQLVPGGAGLIEVPCFEQALERDRFFDIFPDHLSYFTESTLRHALTRVGFEVVCAGRGMGGEFNVAMVVWPGLDRVDALGRASDRISEAFRRFVGQRVAQGKRVAVWGAGGKGLAAMSLAKVHGLAYVIDSDPLKQGRFTPVLHLPVVPPSSLTQDPVDVVVLTALAYRDEIVAQLRDTLGFRGEIVALGSDLERDENR